MPFCGKFLPHIRERSMQHYYHVNHAQSHGRRYRNHLAVVLFGLSIMIMSACGAQPQFAHPQGTLNGCGSTLRLDIVATESARQRGLMGVTSLPDNYGMLFVFDENVQPAFWMKDTLIPLEVVFMSKQGQIHAITAMQPLSEEIHTAPEPLPYALELPQGWMASQGVVVGDTCTIELPDGLVVE